jgi:hypothetical protein
MYVRNKLVKERVYVILGEHTQYKLLNNRRKPPVDFNTALLKLHLKEESFTNTELFNELSVYFQITYLICSNYWITKWRNLIIDELQDHIGKNFNSKDINE